MHIIKIRRGVKENNKAHDVTQSPRQFSRSQSAGFDTARRIALRFSYYVPTLHTHFNAAALPLLLSIKNVCN